MWRFTLQERTLDLAVNFLVADAVNPLQKFVKISSNAEAVVVASPTTQDDAYLALPTRMWGKEYAQIMLSRTTVWVQKTLSDGIR